MAIKGILIIPALIMSAAQATQAQAPGLSAENPKNAIRLAEPFKIVFTVKQSPSFTDVALDTETLKIASTGEGATENHIDEPFAITSVKTLKSKESAIGQFEIEVIPFEIGVTTFPALTWTLRNNQNKTWQIKTSSMNITVSPFVKKEDKDIRDIYPPIKFFSLLKTFAIILLAAAVIAAVIFLTKKKRALSSETTAFKNKKSPYLRAIERIENLEKSAIWKEQKQKKFYVKLSNILRTYIMEDFSITAPLMTTRDLLKKLKKSGDDIELIVKTRELLHFSDLMKFAKFRASEKERDRDISAAKDIISRFYSHRKATEETSGRAANGRIVK